MIITAGRLGEQPCWSEPWTEFSARTVVRYLRQGDIGPAITAAPPAHRGQLASAIRSSFANGINELVVIAGIIALVGAVGSFVLIRGKDFLPRR